MTVDELKDRMLLRELWQWDERFVTQDNDAAERGAPDGR